MKFNKLLIFIVLILLITPIIYSAPKWKQPSTPSTSTQPTQTVIEKTVIINNTATAQESGTDWNMIGGIIAIISVIVGIVGWFLTRKKTGTTSKYLSEINKTFNDFKGNTDNCEVKLVELKSKIEKDFSSGKLTEQSYDILDRKIENYLSDIRKGVINRFDLKGDIKNSIEKALKDGNVSKEEYNSIKNMNLKYLPKDKKEKLLKLLKKWED